MPRDSANERPERVTETNESLGVTETNERLGVTVTNERLMIVLSALCQGRGLPLEPGMAAWLRIMNTNIIIVIIVIIVSILLPVNITRARISRIGLSQRRSNDAWSL